MTVISRSRGFIFIKTRKTAGTSIEVELARRCAADDIVTPIFPENVTHRPRNYSGDMGRFYNHMPAREIRALIGADLYRNSFKFCFERHPVDKCLSHFGMLLNSPHHHAQSSPRSWDEYVERGSFPLDDQLYTDECGALIVDQIYRFDELGLAWAAICRRLDLPAAPVRATEKTGFRAGVPSLSAAMANRSQVNRIMDAFSATLRFIAWR